MRTSDQEVVEIKSEYRWRKSGDLQSPVDGKNKRLSFHPQDWKDTTIKRLRRTSSPHWVQLQYQEKRRKSERRREREEETSIKLGT